MSSRKIRKLWDDKKRENVQKVIDTLLPLTTGVAFIKNMENDFILMELALSSKEPDNLILRSQNVLYKMNKLNRRTIDDFELTYTDLYDIESKENKLFRVYIPLSSDKACFNDKYKFSNILFTFIDKYNLPQYILKSEKYSQINECKYSSDFFYITANIYADSIHEAFLKIEPVIEKFRGLLEFSIGMYSYRVFSSYDSPLRKLAEPPFYIIVEKKSNWEILRIDIDETFNKSFYRLTKVEVDRFNTNINIFARKPEESSILDLVYNSLALYIKALDTRFKYEIFLSFWQLSEMLLLSYQFGGKTEIMSKRFKFFSNKMKTYSCGINYSIEALAEKRNSIVHNGNTNVLYCEIQLIKIICAYIINWLIKESKGLKTVNHLELFYKYKDSNNSDIHNLNDVLTYIVKHRI